MLPRRRLLLRRSSRLHSNRRPPRPTWWARANCAISAWEGTEARARPPPIPVKPMLRRLRRRSQGRHLHRLLPRRHEAVARPYRRLLQCRKRSLLPVAGPRQRPLQPTLLRRSSHPWLSRAWVLPQRALPHPRLPARAFRSGPGYWRSRSFSSVRSPCLCGSEGVERWPRWARIRVNRRSFECRIRNPHRLRCPFPRRRRRPRGWQRA